MQPRQSQAQAVPRGSGRGSLAARPSASGALSSTPQSGGGGGPGSGQHPLLAKAPSRWKAPVAKLLTIKAIAGSALPDDRLPDPELSPVKKGKEVHRWHLGTIYAGFGVLDLIARLLGLMLWKIRYNDGGTPRVSDTQREDVGKAILVTDLMRLVFTGSAMVIRCTVNFTVLWHAFDHLRPSWRERRMRYIMPIFKMLLLIWVLADLLQGCIPNVLPDPTEHRITTPHIVVHQISMYACGLANFILLVVLYNDRDSGELAVVAGVWTLIFWIACIVYYTVYLFKGITGKSTPMGWALVVEVSFLMFNVGRAMPPRIVAMRRMDSSWPKFLREGKVRENEDTSARTGSKPLLLSGVEKPEMEGLVEITNEAGTVVQKHKKRASEDEVLKRQRAELAALNAQIFGAPESEAAGSMEAPQVLADKCIKCGAGLKADAKFCRSCGAPKHNPEAPSAVPPAEPAPVHNPFEP